MAYRRKDHYYHRAKKEGYASRAAFKIIDLDRKYKLLFKGARVLELGCCPGGWSQVILPLVGPTGRVFGVDRVPERPSLPKELIYIEADVTISADRERICSVVERKVDLLLSDMAPDTSGIGFRDRFRSYELAMNAFKVGQSVLKQGGHFLFKILAGEETKRLLSTLKTEFENVITLVPPASRSGSTERYILARRYRQGGKEF